SIFSFQGANPASFGANRQVFAQLMERKGDRLREIDLNISRRSTREILDFVDKVIDFPRAREGLSSDDHIVKHEPHRKGEKGRVEFWPLIAQPAADDPDYWMLPLDLPRPGDAVRTLANEIALRIKHWTDGKTHLPGHEKPIRPRDIMVLTPRREPFAS